VEAIERQREQVLDLSQNKAVDAYTVYFKGLDNENHARYWEVTCLPKVVSELRVGGFNYVYPMESAGFASLFIWIQEKPYQWVAKYKCIIDKEH
jgi:hypothetical protein